MSEYTEDDIDRKLAGGVKPAKFETVGTIVRGRVLSKELQQQRDMKTGETKFWQDGNPMLQIRVVIQTDERDDDDPADDGQRAVYLKGAMENAVKAALKESKSKLLIDGELAVQYTGDGVASQRGFNPPKQYKAKYTPPAPGSNVSIDDL